MINPDRAVANEDLAGADRGCFGLLQAKAIEPAVVPEHDCPHRHDTSCSATPRDHESNVFARGRQVRTYARDERYMIVRRESWPIASRAQSGPRLPLLRSLSSTGWE